ncbi:anti-phage dCTP deaminase [Terrihabitans rhizophilus]|uniref:Anti-phage dCTP deaminase n=1 Tax=Terrihabitans rhizophilus TaxID=3092662 RepID=A0ABU4RPD6_9HYPH|nr:anti-phage dCTP deaminase [Terrihabitans sp. PJ23]MDX6806706.1 anti-phage dCTP deaminase [Terrihabitans sp. PJ23]
MIAAAENSPELVFGTAGPIGVDMDLICRVIAECLSDIAYSAYEVKLTSAMQGYGDGALKQGDSKSDEFIAKMDYANAIRKKRGPDALARIAVGAIADARQKANVESRTRRKFDEDVPAAEIPRLRQTPMCRVAYIVRQLKHPSEVDLLRKVYGKQFILISAYSSEESRRKFLIDVIKRSSSTQLSASEIESKVIHLIERDASEIGEKLGQQLRDTFHLADLFIDGSSQEKMKRGVSRFIQAFFGRTSITPNKDEYGMYAAKYSSLRSGDLSRQVGAAIFSKDGELITQGCNEAPKAGGGTYWDGETPDNRDVMKGFDPNERQKKEVLRDLVERLRRSNFLTDDILKEGSDIAIVDKLTGKAPKGSQEQDGALANSWIMDLTEYGRVVHAEMCALCDAARLGRSLRKATLFCTTFPCHNCTKHLIAAGIDRVVYMEPYPKSRAKELHEDEIELEAETDADKVSFVPFLGISPLRYRDVFQKGRRKSDEGAANVWIERNVPSAMVEVSPLASIANETWALVPLVGKVEAD